MHNISIRYFIPLLFVLFALFEAGVAYYSGIKDAVELTRNEALTAFRVDLTRQQEVIEMLLRSGRLGTLRLYIASMATSEGHQNSLYINPQGKVVSSTNLSLIGMDVSELQSVLANFESVLVEQIRKGKQAQFVDGKVGYENTLSGYLEICVSERGHSIRESGCGLFFHQRDISDKIARAKQLTLQHFYNNLLGILLVLSVMMLFFHYVFNRRVKSLIGVLKSISAGDETIRARVSGRDELGAVANAFNVMLDRIAVSKSRLEESQQALNSAQQQIQLTTERRLKFNVALVFLSQRNFPTAHAAAHEITNICVDLMGISQASIWKRSSDGAWLNCEDLYKAAGRQHKRVDSIPFSDIAGIFSKVGKQGTLCLDDLSQLPAALLKHRKDIIPVDAVSILLTPVWLGGEHVGLLCCSDALTRHDWQEDERHFVEGIAYRITQYKEVEIRNQAEQALRQSEMRLAEAQRIGRMGNWHWDLRSGELRWSDEIFRMIGLDPARDKPNYELFLNCIHPDDRAMLEKEINQSLITGKEYLVEHRLICTNGEELVVEEIGQVLFADGKAIAMDSVVKDITGRKRDEDNLRKLFAKLSESEAKYRLIFELSEDPMWILVGDQFVTANQAAFKLLKYDSMEKLMNTHPSELSPEFQPDGESSYDKSNRMNRLAYEQGHNRFEWMHKKADGEIFPVEVSLTRINYEGQQGLFCLWRDLTQRKALERQLSLQKEQAEEATRAKSEFLANMSHEIRTPMNAIINLSYLAQNPSLPPTTQEYLAKIERAGKNLLGILNDILDLSKVEAHKMELHPQPFNLYELLNNLAVMSDGHSRKGGIDLLFNIADDVPCYLIGDALRLGQVLTNLLSNAIKFTAEGEVVLSVERLDGNNEQDLLLKFQVRDSGIGIREEQRSQLFESFSQADGSISRRYGGTGLGLTISKHLVEMMGGEITIESQFGVGSAFSFTCRLALDDAEQRRSLQYDGVEQLRVLIVDDNVSAQLITHKVLQNFGVDSYVVESAEQAIQQLDAVQHDPQQRYQLVITDWMMPTENGIQLSKRIRQRYPAELQPKIILYSSYGVDLLREQVEKEIDGFVDKPFTPSTLLDEIMRVTKHGYNRAQAESSKAKEMDYQAALAGTRVLVVDDNQINLEIVEMLLSMVDVEVVSVSSAKQAFKVLEETSFDAVLMDIQMPIMDGLQATRQLRQDPRFVELPVIALTANAMRSDVEKSYAAGMNDHITKPIDPQALYRALYIWLPERTESTVKTAPAEEGANSSAELSLLQSEIDQQQGLAYLSGNQQKYQQLLKLFYDNHMETAEQLLALIESGDWEALRRESHSLKGVAATLGANRLSLAAAEVEHDAAQHQLVQDKLDELLNALKAVLNLLAEMFVVPQQNVSQTALSDRASLQQTIQQLLRLSENDVAQALVLSSEFTEQLATTGLCGEARHCANLLNSFDIDAYKEALLHLSQLIDGEA